MQLIVVDGLDIMTNEAGGSDSASQKIDFQFLSHEGNYISCKHI